MLPKGQESRKTGSYGGYMLFFNDSGKVETKVQEEVIQYHT